jgi:hypothetical protein
MSNNKYKKATMPMKEMPKTKSGKPKKKNKWHKAMKK